jgi:hypothetical protein
MQNSEPLAPLGLAIIAVTALLIIVPYLRRKSDAMTAWNLFLLGGAMFMGVACLGVVYGEFRWEQLQWFQPTPEDVRFYVFGSLVFYAALLITYYKLPLPRKIAARFWNKWPPANIPLLVFILSFCCGTCLLVLFVRQVPVVGSVVMNVSHKSAVFAVVFSFCYWYRDKKQVHLLLLFIAVFVFCSLFSMVVYSGRRLLLGIAISPLVCMYWMTWRYRSSKSNLIRLGLVTGFTVIVAGFYSTFRHYRSTTDPTSRSFSTMIEGMKLTSPDRIFSQLTSDGFRYFGDYCAHYSLLTIQLVDTGRAEVEPLRTLRSIVAYPIPRVLWPDKPRSYGEIIVHDVLQLDAQTNWGLGIVGFGAQEGGLPTIALYGFLIVFVLRLFDDPLARQPDNMFLLAMLCSAAPNVAGWIRGECANMTIDLLELFVFTWALALVSRFMFGTAPAGNNVTAAMRHVHPRAGQLRSAGGLPR